MALVKCPDCGKMVSERATICPNCGCPKEFFVSCEEEEQIAEEKETIQDNPKFIEFKVEDHIFRYLESDKNYATMYGSYLQAALAAKTSLESIYDKAGNIVEVLKVLPDKADEYFQNLLNLTTKTLYACKDDITPEAFYNKYKRDFGLEYDEKIIHVFEQYSSIMDKKEHLGNQLQKEIAGRGRWQGGGFGVKGAIKGAVTASVLNAGSDFLHSFGDASKKNDIDRAIRQDLTKLYKNEATRTALCTGIYDTIMGLLDALTYEIVMNIDGTFQSDYTIVNHDTANEIFEAAYRYETDDNAFFYKMLECIENYPGDIRYYEPIYSRLLHEENDFEKFIEFWHIDFLFDTLEADKKDQDILIQLMGEANLGHVDFKDYSEENALKITKIALKYSIETGKELSSREQIANAISNYCKKIPVTLKYLFLGNNELFDLFPESTYEPMFGRNFIYYWKILAGIIGASMADRYTNCDEMPDTIRNKAEEHIGEKILLVHDTSLMSSWKKGFILTNQRLINLTGFHSINVKEITAVNVIVGTEKKIVFKCDNDIFEYEEGKDVAEEVIFSLANVFIAVLIKECQNTLLMGTGMKDSGNVNSDASLKNETLVCTRYSLEELEQHVNGFEDCFEFLGGKKEEVLESNYAIDLLTYSRIITAMQFTLLHNNYKTMLSRENQTTLVSNVIFTNESL